MSYPSTSSHSNINSTERSLLWKLSAEKNGDKYLTFSGNSLSQPINQNRSDNYSVNASINESISPIKVYKIRWYILLVICLANITNAMNWICYSSIADFTGEFYSIDYNSVNYLSLVFLIVSIPTGFLSFYLIDNFGLRSSINLGSWLNFIGAFIRIFSSINSADSKPLVGTSYKYTVLMIGQSICASSQPFILFVSTKFANTWFADDQRALANTIALGSNTFGILIGALISPIMVDNSNQYVSEMTLLNLIYCICSLVPALMACFIMRSTPLLPPSYQQYNQNRNEIQDSSDNDNNSTSFKSYLKQCGKLFKSKDFIILFISFGLGLGLFNSLTTLIEQIVCTRGYSDNDAGYFGGAMILSGIIGSIISGIILDKTKRFEELAKICFSMCAVANIFFNIIQLYDNDKSTIYGLMLLSFILVGFFGLPLLPICMDMSIECVYPIPEATSTGLLFIAGQIFGILVIIGYPKAAKQVDPNSYVYSNVQTCNTAGNTNSNSTTSSMSNQLAVLDFSQPLYAQTILFVLITIFFTSFFKCAYLRIRSEQEKLAEKILSSVQI